MTRSPQHRQRPAELTCRSCPHNALYPLRAFSVFQPSDMLRDMKSCHVAALALVVCIYERHPLIVESHKSLFEPPPLYGHQWRSFDTATDCETYLKPLSTTRKTAHTIGGTGADGRPLFIEGMDHSLCIATRRSAPQVGFPFFFSGVVSLTNTAATCSAFLPTCRACLGA